MIDFKKWFDNLSEDEQDEYNDNRYDLEVVDNVCMGVFDSEHKAQCYFNKGDVDIYTAETVLYKGKYILRTLTEYTEDKSIYDSREEALKDLKKLEWSLGYTIEKEMDLFYESLGEYRKRIDVEPSREYLHPHGNFYSYNIYLDDIILEDTVYELNADEVLSNIKVFNELEIKLKENGIAIIKITKTKDTIGFNRYFSIELYHADKEESVETEIEIPCYYQGNAKKITDFINIDEIIEEFNI